MTTQQTIEIVKILLKHIGEHGIEQDKALAEGCIFLLTSDPTPSMGDATPKEKPKSAPKKRKPFDTGKLRSLYNGGWSVAKIADEMGVSEQTIRNYMAKEGLGLK